MNRRQLLIAAVAAPAVAAMPAPARRATPTGITVIGLGPGPRRPVNPVSIVRSGEEFATLMAALASPSLLRGDVILVTNGHSEVWPAKAP